MLKVNTGDWLSFTSAPARERSLSPVHRTLYYLDPPYYEKGPGLYMNYFNDDDHRNIAAAVASIPHGKWIVTYDNHPFIAALYSRYRQREFSLSYSTTNGKRGEEIMIFSDNLQEIDMTL